MPYKLWAIIISVIIIILYLRSLDTFIPTTLINLDRSPDRLMMMSLQCDLHGIPFKRHPAVDGGKHQFTDEETDMLFGIASGQPGLIEKYSKEDRDALFKKRETEPIFKKTKNIMACALSHIQVWKANSNSREPVLVIEDDTIINPQFKQNVKECLGVLSRFDPDWHIIWLSGGNPGDREIVAHWSLYDIYRMDPPEYIGQGTVGYIMSPKGLAHFLQIIDKEGCSYASDAFLFAHLDTAHAYGVHRPLLGSGLFKSTI